MQTTESVEQENFGLVAGRPESRANPLDCRTVGTR